MSGITQDSYAMVRQDHDGPAEPPWGPNRSSVCSQQVERVDGRRGTPGWIDARDAFPASAAV